MRDLQGEKIVENRAKKRDNGATQAGCGGDAGRQLGRVYALGRRGAYNPHKVRPIKGS
jgi:hypothetical protein